MSVDETNSPPTKKICPPILTWKWDRERLRDWQLATLNRQFDSILPTNRFYREKLGTTEVRLKDLDELSTLPPVS